MSDSDKKEMSLGDLAPIGEILDSDVVKRVYEDGLSPAVKQVGALSSDALKTLRLFTAPIQLLAAYQDRFEGFCQRVRDRVPESDQADAPPEIARPVMEAFASTSDGSAMMKMFEELMARAINKREASKLSPEFPAIIKSLSPLQALLMVRLRDGEQYTDDLRDQTKSVIMKRVGANFNFDDFGGPDHHLTIVQDLEKKNLVTILAGQNVPEGTYTVEIPEGLKLKRMTIRLSMYGKWFADSVTAPK